MLDKEELQAIQKMFAESEDRMTGKIQEFENRTVQKRNILNEIAKERRKNRRPL